MSIDGTKYSRIYKFYRILAYTTFNCLVVLIIVNLLLAGLFLVRKSYQKVDATIHPAVSKYREKFADLDAYTRISSSTVNEYLDQQDSMGSMGFQYAPWVQFHHPEFHGSLLNTDNQGFRRTKDPQSRNGHPIKIYVFGGSTTFGYGVPDDHTIPSYMQTILEERHPDKAILVKNYGQAFYYSSQEMLLFITRLKNGDIPAHAVFVDGGNDTAQLALESDEPIFTPLVKHLWASRTEDSSSKNRQDWSWIPMVRFANGISERFFADKLSPVDYKPSSKKLITSDRDYNEESKNRMVQYILERYNSNIRHIQSLCREYDVQCKFIWQPHPAYKYERTLHRRFPFEEDVPEYFIRVYDYMKGYSSPHFLYLGDMFENSSEKVYIDDVHYNEASNEQIARKICEQLPLHYDRHK